MTPLFWTILGTVVLIVLWLIWTYNRLIGLRNQTDEAWSDIEVQLKRRYDLIPNLIATVKGYAAHETKVFDAVTQARAAAMGAHTPAEHTKTDNMLAGALKNLFAIAEAYPQLRATENFAKLQDELSDTENKIQASRRFYNGNVRDFNTALQTFPTHAIAGTFGFKTPREFFDLDEEAARQPVKVQF